MVERQNTDAVKQRIERAERWRSIESMELQVALQVLPGVTEARQVTLPVQQVAQQVTVQVLQVAQQMQQVALQVQQVQQVAQRRFAETATRSLESSRIARVFDLCLE